jgi:uncharacterized coiled-coil DUF342 family protein
MSDFVTKNDLNEALEKQGDRLESLIDKKINKLDEKIDKAVTELSEIIGTLAQSMHDEIVELKADNREIRDSLNRLMNTIDGFISRIDHYETEMVSRDAQFARLLEWAREVSEKTGIPLKGF